jgi:hypothetical protein
MASDDPGPDRLYRCDECNLSLWLNDAQLTVTVEQREGGDDEDGAATLRCPDAGCDGLLDFVARYVS